MYDEPREEFEMGWGNESGPSSEPENAVQADALFKGRREIWIELDGVRYRLRITRRNRLILQK